jgi:sialic acid synthase SpsE
LSVGLGARIIEKHFTLDKTQTSFRDHQLSADPSDFERMVQGVRNAEKLLGRGEVSLRQCEQAALSSARRSIAAAADLPAGHVVESTDVTWLRPGNGIPPGEESKIVGRKLKTSIPAGHLFSEKHFS